MTVVNYTVDLADLFVSLLKIIEDSGRASERER